LLDYPDFQVSNHANPVILEIKGRAFLFNCLNRDLLDLLDYPDFQVSNHANPVILEIKVKTFLPFKDYKAICTR
jgi:hypothetical protein